MAGSPCMRSLENLTVNAVFSRHPLTPLRPALPLLALALALAMAGCTSTEGLLSGDKLDYRTRASKTEPLEVPPDLTQLAREGRYLPQSGVVSASSLKQAGAAPLAAPGTAPGAPAAAGDLRVERLGNSRWLVTNLTPEVLYPQLRAFWLERGFVLTEDNPQIGVMETAWAENRAKIPMDFIRNTLGRVLENLYSTPERDRYRTRIERTPTGSEVYISHRGMVEIYTTQQRDSTVWQVRPTDPELEAEFLSRLMVKLGAKEDTARSTVATAPAAPAKARLATVASSATMEIDDSFDRAWRQVGLALDRSGFTVEDRDRTAGLYFVRYIDPKQAGKDEPNFFSKLFGGDKDAGRAQRYRVLVKAAGAKSQVSVQTSQGTADDGEIARQIIGRLTDELR